MASIRKMRPLPPSERGSAAAFFAVADLAGAALGSLTELAPLLVAVADLLRVAEDCFVDAKNPV